MSLRERCGRCATWPEPVNCGHGLVDGIPAPALYFTRPYVEGVELGPRVSRWLMIENHSVKSRRLWTDSKAA